MLLKYRSTPHSVTGLNPCSLMLKRDVSVLDLVKPNSQVKIQNKRADQKMNHDRRSKVRELEVGQVVMVGDYQRHEDKLIEGVITTKKRDLSFVVRLVDGSYCR